MKEELTAELYGSWRQHPVTQALFAVMAQEIEDIKETWLRDNFSGEIEQARERERAQIYRALISQTAEEFLQSVGESE